MARMIPPYLSNDIKSTGEKRIYELFRTDPATADWVVIHSLGLARHVNRLYGEIDFVVLAPGEGVFCLEVKSGRVERREGVWTFTNRFGSISTRTVSPFMQAREGMFSLLNAVRRKFGSHHRLSNLLYKYGVMFPDIHYEDADPEHESWEVYDWIDRRRPISAFIKRLSAAAHKQVHGTAWYIPSESRPTQRDVEALVEFLRGDFECIVPPAAVLQDIEEELLHLTEEQYQCLDQLENNPRCLFEGGAGTGKTLIAMEFARRESLRGRRVLMLCYNRFLGARISSDLSQSSAGSNITASSFHRYLQSLIDLSSYREEFRSVQRRAEDEELYRTTYPLYALVAIQEGVIEPFDSMIVDEGQDLICHEYLDVLDALLRGGLNGGRWAMFCDFHRQAIYTDISAEQMIAQVEERVSRYVRFRLTVNCRNTRPIGEETALLSGFETPPFLPAKIEGLPVDYRFYTDTDVQRQCLRDILNQLLAEGVPPGCITVLAPVSKASSCLSTPIEGLNCQIEDLSELTPVSPQDKAVRFATIHAFKGLENSVIILTDVKDLSSRSQSLLYIGMSRARQRLFVLISETARKNYSAALQRKMESLITKS